MPIWSDTTGSHLGPRLPGRLLASRLLSGAGSSLRAGSAPGQLPCEPRRVPRDGAKKNTSLGGPGCSGGWIPSRDSAEREPALCHLRWAQMRGQPWRALLPWNPAPDTAWAAPMTLVSGVRELPGSPRPGLRRHLSRHVLGLLCTAGLGTSGMSPGLSRGEQVWLVLTGAVRASGWMLTAGRASRSVPGSSSSWLMASSPRPASPAWAWALGE